MITKKVLMLGFLSAVGAIALTIYRPTIAATRPNAVKPRPTSPAKSPQTSQPKSKPPAQVIYKPAKLGGRGTPQNLPDGGGRRGCGLAQQHVDDELIAIVPKTGVGLANSLKPTVWIYSPYKSTQPLRAILTVRRSLKAGDGVGTAVVVSLPQNPGLAPVQLTQPLENGQVYQWFLTVQCGEISENPYVEGNIRIQVNPSLGDEIKQLSTPAKAARYAAEGYWYDALTLVVGSSLRQDLSDLLGSGGLKSIAPQVTATK